MSTSTDNALAGPLTQAQNWMKYESLAVLILSALISLAAWIRWNTANNECRMLQGKIDEKECAAYKTGIVVLAVIFTIVTLICIAGTILCLMTNASNDNIITGFAISNIAFLLAIFGSAIWLGFAFDVPKCPDWQVAANSQSVVVTPSGSGAPASAITIAAV